MKRPRQAQETERSADLARERGLGAWRTSLGVNRTRDATMRSTLLMLAFVAPWGPLAGVYFLGPWQEDPKGPLFAFVLMCVVSVAFLALAVGALFGLIGSRIIGKATIHLYEHGAVIERERGDRVAFSYGEARARYVVWQEEWDGNDRDRVQMWIEVYGHEDLICLDGFNARDGAALPVIARAFGIRDVPVPIGRLESEKPVDF